MFQNIEDGWQSRKVVEIKNNLETNRPSFTNSKLAPARLSLLFPDPEDQSDYFSDILDALPLPVRSLESPPV
ncbi:MAG: hypothetical protein Q9206_006253 [Seirophora lacunosa]